MFDSHSAPATPNFEIIGEYHRWYGSTDEIEDLRDRRRYPASSYLAKVNVYEDRVRNWFLDIAIRETAQGAAPGDYVALSIALAYLEGVEQYRRGETTPRWKAGEWFKASAARVFPSAPEQAIARLWTEVRNGLFHASFTSGATHVTHDCANALELSGPYLRINPARFALAVATDFEQYICELRSDPSGDLALRFVRLWDQQWAKT